MTSQTIVRPLPSRRRRQRLRDDALQAVRQLGADLLLLVGREDVDEPVDGLRGGLGVQRGEHEVAGLGGGDRDRGRLEVAQLADQDDVRVLAQHVPQRGREVLGVRADLALVDDAAAVVCRYSIGSSIVMMCADRVLLATSSRLASVVDLPEPVGPVTSTRPRGRWANRSMSGGRPEFGEAADVVRDGPQHGADRAALQEDVDAEAADVLQRVGGVEFVGRLELRPVLAATGSSASAPRCPAGVSRAMPSIGRSEPCTRMHGAMPGGEVQVGAAAFDGHPEQVVE